MTENRQNHNHSWHDRLSHGGVLRVLRRNVMLRAALAIVTVVLTIVLVFSLTVAWYTNVVQTGGLVLESETWNFSGTIELLMSESVSAMPGDEGFVSLRVSNPGDHIVAASATVNKQTMDTEMQKRLYFYVDTVAERNDEQVDRVYIAEKSSYTYTVFPQSELILTETVQNAPPIKWIWVYDVLGYYVRGQKTADGTTVTPEDYIRPIEYAYDPVYTTFDLAGNLQTVDGNKSAASFVAELTAADGYAGTVDMTAGSVGGYYPVSVNEVGYGVWLYLCTADEIAEHTAYDTALGQNQTQPSCTATVTITGSNSREDGIPVTSVQELQAALSDPTVGIIRLADDLQLTQTLSLTGGSATIDLNGKTLSAGSDVQKIFDLTNGARLALRNGKIQGSGTTDDYAAVTTSGSHLTMTDVQISGLGTGVLIHDDTKTTETGSTVYITGCVVETAQQALWIYGNKSTDQTRTHVVVEGSTLNGVGYAGILCNGTYSGTDILVSDSTVKGLYTSIYHPQHNSTLTIEHSELYGFTGLVVKGGTVTVTDTFVQATATASDQLQAPQINGNGWSDTGDGIYLEANYSEAGAVSLTVTNCTVSSLASLAIRQYPLDGVSDVTFTVVSGIFSSYAGPNVSAPENFDAAAQLQTYLADRSTATNDSDNSKKCTVRAGTATE